MAALDATAVAGALKELYPDDDVREAVYKNAPFFGMLEKDTDASGEHYKCALIFGHPQGRSADFQKARSGQQPGGYAGFEVTYVDDYSTAAIAGRVIDATRNNRGAFVRALEQEVDGSLHQLKRSIHHSVFRNGGGALGQISAGSTVASLTITLANPADSVFFEKGQEIGSSATDGTSGTQRAGTATITAIDRSAGTLTTDANWSTQITGCAVNDYLFVDGDFGAKMGGLDLWLPASAPTTSLYGVARADDPTRLGGVRYDGSNQTLVEALIDGVERVQREGGMPDCIFMHTSQVSKLAKHMESKRAGTRKSEDGRMSYKSFTLETSAGDLDVVGDINCQTDIAWVLQMDTWTMASMGNLPKLLDDDGLPYLRQADADGVEVRNVYRANLACKAPGYNGRISIAA